MTLRSVTVIVFFVCMCVGVGLMTWSPLTMSFYKMFGKSSEESLAFAFRSSIKVRSFFLFFLLPFTFLFVSYILNGLVTGYCRVYIFLLVTPIFGGYNGKPYLICRVMLEWKVNPRKSLGIRLNER